MSTSHHDDPSLLAQAAVAFVSRGDAAAQRHLEGLADGITAAATASIQHLEAQTQRHNHPSHPTYNNHHNQQHQLDVSVEAANTIAGAVASFAGLLTSAMPPLLAAILQDHQQNHHQQMNNNNTNSPSHNSYGSSAPSPSSDEPACLLIAAAVLCGRMLRTWLPPTLQHERARRFHHHDSNLLQRGSPGAVADAGAVLCGAVEGLRDAALAALLVLLRVCVGGSTGSTEAVVDAAGLSLRRVLRGGGALCDLTSPRVASAVGLLLRVVGQSEVLGQTLVVAVSARKNGSTGSNNENIILRLLEEYQTQKPNSNAVYRPAVLLEAILLAEGGGGNETGAHNHGRLQHSLPWLQPLLAGIIGGGGSADPLAALWGATRPVGGGGGNDSALCAAQVAMAVAGAALDALTDRRTRLDPITRARLRAGLQHMGGEGDPSSSSSRPSTSLAGSILAFADTAILDHLASRCLPLQLMQSQQTSSCSPSAATEAWRRHVLFGSGDSNHSSWIEAVWSPHHQLHVSGGDPSSLLGPVLHAVAAASDGLCLLAAAIRTTLEHAANFGCEASSRGASSPWAADFWLRLMPLPYIHQQQQQQQTLRPCLSLCWEVALGLPQTLRLALLTATNANSSSSGAAVSPHAALLASDLFGPRSGTYGVDVAAADALCAALEALAFDGSCLQSGGVPCGGSGGAEEDYEGAGGGDEAVALDVSAVAAAIVGAVNATPASSEMLHPLLAAVAEAAGPLLDATTPSYAAAAVDSAACCPSTLLHALYPNDTVLMGCSSQYQQQQQHHHNGSTGPLLPVQAAMVDASVGALRGALYAALSNVLTVLLPKPVLAPPTCPRRIITGSGNATSATQGAVPPTAVSQAALGRAAGILAMAAQALSPQPVAAPDEEADDPLDYQDFMAVPALEANQRRRTTVRTLFGASAASAGAGCGGEEAAVVLGASSLFVAAGVHASALLVAGIAELQGIAQTMMNMTSHSSAAVSASVGTLLGPLLDFYTTTQDEATILYEVDVSEVAAYATEGGCGSSGSSGLPAAPLRGAPVDGSLLLASTRDDAPMGCCGWAPSSSSSSSFLSPGGASDKSAAGVAGLPEAQQQMINAFVLLSRLAATDAAVGRGIEQHCAAAICAALPAPYSSNIAMHGPPEPLAVPFYWWDPRQGTHSSASASLAEMAAASLGDPLAALPAAVLAAAACIPLTHIASLPYITPDSVRAFASASSSSSAAAGAAGGGTDHALTEHLCAFGLPFGHTERQWWAATALSVGGVGAFSHATYASAAATAPNPPSEAPVPLPSLSSFPDPTVDACRWAQRCLALLDGCRGSCRDVQDPAGLEAAVELFAWRWHQILAHASLRALRVRWGSRYYHDYVYAGGGGNNSNDSNGCADYSGAVFYDEVAAAGAWLDLLGNYCTQLARRVLSSSGSSGGSGLAERLWCGLWVVMRAAECGQWRHHPPALQAHLRSTGAGTGGFATTDDAVRASDFAAACLRQCCLAQTTATNTSSPQPALLAYLLSCLGGHQSVSLKTAAFSSLALAAVADTGGLPQEGLMAVAQAAEAKYASSSSNQSTSSSSPADTDALVALAMAAQALATMTTITVTGAAPSSLGPMRQHLVSLAAAAVQHRIQRALLFVVGDGSSNSSGGGSLAHLVGALDGALHTLVGSSMRPVLVALAASGGGGDAAVGQAHLVGVVQGAVSAALSAASMTHHDQHHAPLLHQLDPSAVAAIIATHPAVIEYALLVSVVGEGGSTGGSQEAWLVVLSAVAEARAALLQPHSTVTTSSHPSHPPSISSPPLPPQWLAQRFLAALRLLLSPLALRRSASSSSSSSPQQQQQQQHRTDGSSPMEEGLMWAMRTTRETLRSVVVGSVAIGGGDSGAEGGSCSGVSTSFGPVVALGVDVVWGLLQLLQRLSAAHHGLLEEGLRLLATLAAAEAVHCAWVHYEEHRHLQHPHTHHHDEMGGVVPSLLPYNGLLPLEYSSQWRQNGGGGGGTGKSGNDEEGGEEEDAQGQQHRHGRHCAAEAWRELCRTVAEARIHCYQQHQQRLQQQQQGMIDVNTFGTPAILWEFAGHLEQQQQQQNGGGDYDGSEEALTALGGGGGGGGGSMAVAVLQTALRLHSPGPLLQCLRSNTNGGGNGSLPAVVAAVVSAVELLRPLTLSAAFL